MKVIFYIDWTEVEFGWGDRPDGFSIHLTPETAEEYKRINTINGEYHRWFGSEVGFKSVPDNIYTKLEKLINETNGKLGIKSSSWSLKTAIEKLVGE